MTGVGLVSPLGIGTEQTWQGLLAGRSGAGPITLFDASLHTTRFACEVKGFDPLRYDGGEIRAHAMHWDRRRFRARLVEAVREAALDDSRWAA